MNRYQALTSFFLRLSLATGFLSAVASRLGLWGSYSSGWTGFLSYTAEVNSFLPATVIPVVAVASTVLEASIGLCLLFGVKTKFAAISAGTLSLLFAVAMSWSFGVKEPLDYSVFAFSAGGFLLATTSQELWSIDNLTREKNKK